MKETVLKIVVGIYKHIFYVLYNICTKFAGLENQ